jgi:hypothetical protein
MSSMAALLAGSARTGTSVIGAGGGPRWERGEQQLIRQRWELAVDADLAVNELLQLQGMEEPRRRLGDADGGGPGRPPECRRWTGSNSGSSPSMQRDNQQRIEELEWRAEAEA